MVAEMAEMLQGLALQSSQAANGVQLPAESMARIATVIEKGTLLATSTATPQVPTASARQPHNDVYSVNTSGDEQEFEGNK
eukprot:6353484-Lingulodinium_polyedra.AAC.1